MWGGRGEGRAPGLLPWPPSLGRGECRGRAGAAGRGLAAPVPAFCKAKVSAVPPERLASGEGKGCAAPELETSGLLGVFSGGSLLAGPV